MTTNTTKTVHTFTYRYTDAEAQKDKTSKLSIDIGVYNLLKENEDYLLEDVKRPNVVRGKTSTKTDWWLYAEARRYREENPEAALTGCIRELVFCKLIDPSFLDGYEINSDYVKVMCKKDDNSNTAARLPSSLYFAIKSMYEDACDDLIQAEYTKVRSEFDDNETSYSYQLRHNLLKLVADPLVEFD